MKGLAVITSEDAPQSDRHPIAGHHIDAPCHCRLLSPDEYSLWMVLIKLEEKAEIRLPSVKGDEAIYVLEGAVSVGDETSSAGGAIIIESASSEHVRVIESATLIHMGPVDPVVPADGLNGPVTQPGVHTHVVGAAGHYAALDEVRDSRYFADSTCPSCRLTLFYTSRFSAYSSATHSHSVDELIHVLWGEIQLGRHRLKAGDTLAVDADRRYGFRADEGGFGFLNYRRDASEQTIERGSEPRMEGALVNGFELVEGL